MNKTQKEELRDMILQEASKGNIIFMTIEGAVIVNLNEFIKQPAEGILYDLNRDKVTIITSLDDPKWVNDFAVASVIEKLKTKIETMQPVIDAAKAFVNQAISFQEWLKTGNSAKSSHELYRLLKTAICGLKEWEAKKFYDKQAVDTDLTPELKDLNVTVRAYKEMEKEKRGKK